jgi:hypothetical protein
LLDLGPAPGDIVGRLEGPLAEINAEPEGRVEAQGPEQELFNLVRCAAGEARRHF